MGRELKPRVFDERVCLSDVKRRAKKELRQGGCDLKAAMMTRHRVRASMGAGEPTGVSPRVVGKRRRGNCYVTCESLFYLLGGKAAGYTPMVLRHEGDTHWYLKHSSGLILDPTVSQFRIPPDYSKGRGCGFLTREPSKRATSLMQVLVYQQE